MSKTEPESPAPITIARQSKISVADQSPLSWRYWGLFQKTGLPKSKICDMKFKRLQEDHRSTDHQTESIALYADSGRGERRLAQENVRARENERKPRRSALSDEDHSAQNCHRTPNRRSIVTLSFQDIVMESRNTRYAGRLPFFPHGTLIVGQRPDGVDSHFGPALDESFCCKPSKSLTQGRLLGAANGA